jgi:uncharacterized membrane protein YvbJ
MKCPRCQSENWDTDTQCSSCGASLAVNTQQSTPPPQAQSNYQQVRSNQKPQTQDKLNPVLAILAFIIPLIGFILYFVWKDEKPQSARTIGMIALIAFGLTMMFYACVGCAMVSDY